MELDSTNKKILNLIQRGDLCTPKITKIAEILKLPAATVYTRLKKLENEDIIKGYPAIIDPKKVGKKLSLVAIVKVIYPERYSDKKTMYSFGESLAKIDEIQEVHACSADWDYLIKLKAKDADDYHKIQSEKILPLGGIEKLESVVAYKTFKESHFVQVD